MHGVSGRELDGSAGLVLLPRGPLASKLAPTSRVSCGPLGPWEILCLGVALNRPWGETPGARESALILPAGRGSELALGGNPTIWRVAAVILATLFILHEPSCCRFPADRRQASSYSSCSAAVLVVSQLAGERAMRSTAAFAALASVSLRQQPQMSPQIRSLWEGACSRRTLMRCS
jgi:hypothetical protein